METKEKETPDGGLVCKPLENEEMCTDHEAIRSLTALLK